MQLNILWHQNCRCLSIDFLKKWPSNSSIATGLALLWVFSAVIITTIKHLADGCSRIFALHSSTIKRAYNALPTEVHISSDNSGAFWNSMKHVYQSISMKIRNR